MGEGVLANEPQGNESLPGKIPILRMVAWEVTRRCNLSCSHCRAAAERGPYPGELSPEEALRLIDEIASFSKPVVILTGGEPLLREDIFDLARSGTERGLRMVMAPNGTLIDGEKALRIKESGIQRVSISLDGATPETHDRFRRVEGAFAGALRGIEHLKKVGMEFQINTTVTRGNCEELPEILDLAVRLGAAAHHMFLLVPTGRGKELEGAGDSSGGIRKGPELVIRAEGKIPPATEGNLRPAVLPNSAPADESGRTEVDSADPRPRRDDAGVSRRDRFLFHFPSRGGAAVRISGGPQRQHSGTKLARNLGEFAGVSEIAGFFWVQRAVRALRIHPGLRGLPGPGLRENRGSVGGRTSLHLFPKAFPCLLNFPPFPLRRSKEPRRGMGL